MHGLQPHEGSPAVIASCALLRVAEVEPTLDDVGRRLRRVGWPHFFGPRAGLGGFLLWCCLALLRHARDPHGSVLTRSRSVAAKATAVANLSRVVLEACDCRFGASLQGFRPFFVAHVFSV